MEIFGDDPVLVSVEIGDATFRGCPPSAKQRAVLTDRHRTFCTVEGLVHERLDEEALAFDLFDATVTEWSNVRVQGQEIACTREAKRVLWNRNQNLAAEVLRRVRREHAALLEAARGN